MKCPGIYCGRMVLENNTLSECGSCDRGYRVNNLGICTPCENTATAYDWLYLGFMGLLPLIMHWFFIDMAAKERSFSKPQIIMHVCATLEVFISAILSLLISPPVLSLNLYSCGVQKLSDWYTLFHNPQPNYDKKIYCTSEAVYPLQTIVLIFYLLCLLLMMLVRPVLNRKFLKAGKSAVYCALYFFPILTLLHAVAGGLIYYSFPYLSIILSMVSNACHYSMKIDQSMKSLLKYSLMEVKNTVIIIGHWLILAYGILSLRQHYALLALVPFPSLFYIITVKFTDPAEFRERDERNVCVS